MLVAAAIAVPVGLLLFFFVQVSGEETCSWLSDEERSLRSLRFDVDGDGEDDALSIRCDSGIAASWINLSESSEIMVEDLVIRAETGGWIVSERSSGNRYGSVRFFRSESGWERTELEISFRAEDPDTAQLVSLSASKEPGSP